MQKTQQLKKAINNNQGPFDWVIGKPETNVIVQSRKIGVEVLRYSMIEKTRDPNKDKTLYDTIVIKEPPNNTVTIIRNETGEIGLIHEWRPVPERWFWACIRGFGDPDDIDAVDTAKRETIEEIGDCKIIKSQTLGVMYPNTTFYIYPIHVILLDVEVLKLDTSSIEGIDEFRYFNEDEIRTMIRENKINDQMTVCALAMYLL